MITGACSYTSAASDNTLIIGSWFYNFNFACVITHHIHIGSFPKGGGVTLAWTSCPQLSWPDRISPCRYASCTVLSPSSQKQIYLPVLIRKLCITSFLKLARRTWLGSIHYLASTWWDLSLSSSSLWFSQPIFPQFWLPFWLSRPCGRRTDARAWLCRQLENARWRHFLVDRHGDVTCACALVDDAVTFDLSPTAFVSAVE